MNNELYYNKYLFNQTGGREPMSTHDLSNNRNTSRMGRMANHLKFKNGYGYNNNSMNAEQQQKMDNIISATSDGVFDIGEALVETGVKGISNLASGTIDKIGEVVGIDPNESVEESTRKLREKVFRGAEIVGNLVKDPEVRDLAINTTANVLDLGAEMIENNTEAAIKIADTLVDASDIVAGELTKQGIIAARGVAADVASAVPVVGPVVALANTVDNTISQTLPAIDEAITAGAQISEAISEATRLNAKAVERKENVFHEQGREWNHLFQRASKAIRDSSKEVSDTIRSTEQMTKIDNKKPDDLYKDKTHLRSRLENRLGRIVGDKAKMEQFKKDGMKNLVDMGAEATGMKNTVRAARTMGVSDEKILNKTAKIASKTVGGSKTRKKRKRKRKGKNKTKKGRTRYKRRSTKRTRKHK